MQARNLEGFILTRQWLETRSGLEIVFWLWTESGPYRIRLADQESVCFVNSNQSDLIHKTLRAVKGWRIKETRLKNFAHEPVSALYFKSQRLLYSAREKLLNVGLPCLEADVKPPDRYLMERFITGGVILNGSAVQRDGFLDLSNIELKSSSVRPNFKRISIDIETDFSGENLYSIALYSAETSIVLMLDPERVLEVCEPLEFEIQSFSSVAELLEAFVRLLAILDVDVFMGWNVVNFDLVCLQKFADESGVKLRLGRNGEEVRWRFSADGKERAYALVPGRIVLDGIELMRSATYQFENFSLEFVSRQLLGRGKLVEDVDLRGAEITHLFQSSKLELASYNLEDCKLVWDIFEKENLIDFAIERSLLTGLELDRYGGSVAALDFLYLPRLHRQGYVAPALEELQSSNVSPGGYVMNSIPGIHDHVIVLDFKSLYPSIIRTFNVDPLALVVGQKEPDPIIGFDGGKFSRSKTILPELIENLWAARDIAKSNNNQVLSQAIKIIMNSFYGVLGTTGCRFLDSRLVSSITKRGHEIIIQSKKYIESQGLEVIYGDTDSVFVLMGNAPHLDVASAGTQLASALNHWWSKKLEAEHQVASCLEIQFETHYAKFFMPTIRGSDAGSKKRYAGLTNDDKLIFKGLESVRSDWSQLAREFQQNLYSKIFHNLPYTDYVKETVTGLTEGDCDDKLVLRKRLRRKLKDYVKNVPPHVQAARKAELIRKERELPPMYDSGGWIEYLMTVNGPEPKLYSTSVIDYDFYIDRQLAPIADSILVFDSTTLAEVINRQIGLF